MLIRKNTIHFNLLSNFTEVKHRTTYDYIVFIYKDLGYQIKVFLRWFIDYLSPIMK